MTFNNEKILNIPNSITAIRLIGVLAMFLIINLVDSEKIYFFIFWIYLSERILDLADGWAAKYFNQKTSFGEMFDRVVDKIADLVLLSLVLTYEPLLKWGWYVTEVPLFLSIFLQYYFRKSASSGWAGKTKTILRSMAIVILIVITISKYNHPYAPITAISLYTMSYIFGVFSNVIHYRKFFSKTS